MGIESIAHSVTSLLNFFKVLAISKKGNKMPTSTSSELTILANGPSLKPLLEADKAFEGDVIVVNSFHKSAQFKSIKPKYYIISAPEFWLPMKQEFYVNMQNELEDSLTNDVEWEMTFFIPYKSKKYNYKQKLDAIENITAVYYNDTAIDGEKGLDRWSMNQKWAMPRPHNILIPSLMVGIWMKYEKINVFGADHSWLPMLHVDEHNNALLNQVHFYDTDKKSYLPMYKGKEKTRKLHEILHKFYLSFKAYHSINRFAKSKGTTIINCTKGSFIDAFERNTEEK
jgi:hypothetical protein